MYSTVSVRIGVYCTAFRRYINDHQVEEAECPLCGANDHIHRILHVPHGPMGPTGPMGMAFTWRGCSLPTSPPGGRRSPPLRTRGYVILRLVCRKSRPVSVEDEVLVDEDCSRAAYTVASLGHGQHYTLAPTSPRREVGQARSNQSAGHAEP